MQVKQTENELIQAENEIRDFIRESGSPFNPLDLFAKLRKAHFSEYVMRLALWSLIDRDEILITPDRKLDLRVRNGQPHQSGAASLGR